MTKINTITINKKEQTLAIAKVRALLKKNGYNVGYWGANGRISGMSNFYGDLEVKGNEFDFKCASKKSGTSSTWIHTYTKFVNVEVRSWSDEISTKDIATLLENNGLIIKSIESDRVIVDNK